MSSVPATTDPTAPSSMSRLGRWCRDGLRLWRRAPFMLIALGFCCLMVEALLQQIPWAGVLISKVVVPMCVAGIWLGLDELQRGGRMRFSSLWAGWRHPRWIPLWVLSGLTGLLVSAFQFAGGWMVYGHDVVDAVVFGNAAAHPALLTRSFEYVLVLPGELPATLLLLATPLFLFRGASIAAAIRGSIRIVLAAPFAFGLLMLLGTALLALCLVNGWALFLLVLVLMPWSNAVGYAAWNDVATHPYPDARA